MRRTGNDAKSQPIAIIAPTFVLRSRHRSVAG